MLKGNEIRLRALEPHDVELLYRWENDPAIWTISHTLTPFSQFTLKQYIASSAQDIYTSKQLRLMIDELHNRKTIGVIDIFDFDPFHRRAGIGILIDAQYRQSTCSTCCNCIKSIVTSWLTTKPASPCLPTPASRLSATRKSGY